MGSDFLEGKRISIMAQVIEFVSLNQINISNASKISSKSSKDL
ncbi:MAG: hypothetical protein ACI94Y_003517 [Maribacter sp.]|jgi:hypothetical protein